MTEAMSTTEAAGVTDEQIDAIIAGCEGVTPGPWFHEESWSPKIGWVNDADPLNDGGSLATIWGGGRPDGEAGKAAAHIARLDPDTIRSAFTELRELRALRATSSSPSDGGVIEALRIVDGWAIGNYAAGSIFGAGCTYAAKEIAAGIRASLRPPAPASAVTGWRQKTSEHFFDATVRIEEVIYIPGAVADMEATPERFDEFCESLPEGAAHPIFVALPELASFAGIDEEPRPDLVAEKLLFKPGFLVQAATPVRSDGESFSWGHYWTAWLYAATEADIEGVCLEWAESRVKDRTEKRAASPEPSSAMGVE